MTEVQTITPDANRYFPDSLGDWQGDAEWFLGPYSGHFGVMYMWKDFPQQLLTVSLPYPHCYLKPSCQPKVSFWMRFPGDNQDRHVIFSATDGNQTISIQKDYPNYPDVYTFSHTFDPVAGWNKENTIIKIQSPVNTAYHNFVIIDDVWFGFEPIQKIQYLTLLGAG